MERIEHETEILERHDAEEGLWVAGFAEDNRRVSLSVCESEMTFGNGT